MIIVTTTSVIIEGLPISGKTTVATRELTGSLL